MTEFSVHAPFRETLRLRQAGVKPSVPVNNKTHFAAVRVSWQNHAKQPTPRRTMKPKNLLSEKALQSLEANIPKMAQAAFSQAHLNALTISGKVLQASDGKLVELSAEGAVRFIKAIEPPFQVQTGIKRTRRVVRS